MAQDLLRGAAVMTKVLNTSNWREKLKQPDETQAEPHIPFGYNILDYLIGGTPNKFGVRMCPGIPKARISIFSGRVGKTTLALTVAASVIKQGGKVVFIGQGNAFPFEYSSQIGIPQVSEFTWDKGKILDLKETYTENSFLLIATATPQEVFQAMYAAASMRADLIVCDPVVGHIAWSDFTPVLRDRIAKSGSAVILSVQRGEPEEVSRHFRFYCSLHLNLMPTAIKGQDQEVLVEVVRCKVADSQGKQTKITLRDGVGLINDADPVPFTPLPHEDE